MIRMNNLDNPHNIPNPHLEQEREITQEERNKLMHFNTKRFWHCFYDKDSRILYNEYGRRVMDDAYDYLLGIGMIDSESNQIEWFESESSKDK